MNRRKVVIFYTLVIVNVICMLISFIEQNLFLAACALGLSLFLKKRNRNIPVPKLLRDAYKHR